MVMGDAPVAGRLRRPGWRDPRLLVGVLLIAISVTAVSAVVSAADQTSEYYAVRDTLTPGTVVTRDDVKVVRARLGGDAYMAPGDEPWGLVLTRVVGKGELLPSEALADAEDVESRTIAVRTTLPLADGIEVGSLVDIYLTTDDEGEPRTRAVARSLTVESVEEDDGSFAASSLETVYVAVPDGEIEDLLDALATKGEISVVGMGGGA